MDFFFRDLVDLDKIKPLTDNFCEALGLASSIGELDGTRLLSSGDKKLCTRFHRAYPESRKACQLSRTTLIESMAKGQAHVLYRCKNGLNDAVTPIKVRDQHVANFYIGQFLYGPPDIPYFRNQAQKYDFDETAYLKALEEIPVIKEKRIIRLLEFVSSFAGMLGELGLRNLEQTEESAREIKLLSGLLPICSSCKKIRDDKGYWNQIETYIQEHSQAQFSHGICPECAGRIYGDEAWYNQIKNLKDK
ncbi:PocR ligand-binding domain-containing protein [Desulfospira joergensenii]|uniref:PocR ligand-binding domain-containing protein n=1 Tax=Desulfospira joergensenii TaxID=53329 RepID=UPI0003B67E8F|nr:PocR ligand-binding domain-containing protein [Desulfospira joergensenii]